MQNSTTIIAVVLAVALLIAVPVVLLNTNSISVGEMPAEWSSFMNEEEYNEFTKLVIDYFEENNVKISIVEGRIAVKGAGHSFPEDIGLFNVAQECHQVPQSEWKRVITHYLNSVKQTAAVSRDLSEKAKNYEEIADILNIRIWSTDYVQEENLAQYVYQKDLEGTFTILVFDLPTAVRNVGADEAALWGKTNEELFQVALENLQKTYPPIISPLDVVDTQIYVIETDSFFANSYVLLLDQYPELVGKYGSIVSVPNRSLTTLYPINDSKVFSIMEMMIRAAQGLYLEGPGSVTPNVYWYHDGQFLNLPYEIDKKNIIHFYAPEEFTIMLESLSRNE